MDRPEIPPGDREAELVSEEKSYPFLRPRQLTVGSNLEIETQSGSRYMFRVLEETQFNLVLRGRVFRKRAVFSGGEYCKSSISRNGFGLEVGKSFSIEEGQSTSPIVHINASFIKADDQNDEAAKNLVEELPKIPLEALRRILGRSGFPNCLADTITHQLNSRGENLLPWEITLVTFQLMRDLLKSEVPLEKTGEVVRVFGNYARDHDFSVGGNSQGSHDTRYVRFPRGEKIYDFRARLTAQGRVGNLLFEEKGIAHLGHHIVGQIRRLLPERFQDRWVKFPSI